MMIESNNDKEDSLSSNLILTSTLNPPVDKNINHNGRNNKILILLFLLLLLLFANQYFGWIMPNKSIEPQLILGPQGDPGVAGRDGLAGKDGATGPRGSQGLKGEPGAQGLPGTQGATGATGSTGATGATGPAGSGSSGGGSGSGSGTGTVTLGTCDSDILITVNSKYVPYSATVANNWVVDVLTISNIDSTACNGKKVTLVLLQGNGTILVTSNQLTIAGTSLAFNCTPDSTGACTGSGFPSSPVLRSNLLDSVTLEVAS